MRTLLARLPWNSTNTSVSSRARLCWRTLHHRGVQATFETRGIGNAILLQSRYYSATTTTNNSSSSSSGGGGGSGGSSGMAPAHPKEGSTLTAKFQVQPSDLASAISPDPTDDYAKVLATPRLVGFMEIVCARMLVPHMNSGQLSVGVRVEMDHLAATPVGEEVSVTATFLRKEGKQLVFDTVITDAGGEIGRGVCRRAVIDEKRLMDGAKKRIGGGSKL